MSVKGCAGQWNSHRREENKGGVWEQLGSDESGQDEDYNGGMRSKSQISTLIGIAVKQWKYIIGLRRMMD